MSLSVALQVAQSALSARQTQMATVSRNVAGAQDAGYTRKSVILSTVTSSSGQPGGVRVDGISRTTDAGLYATLLRSTSVGTAQQALLDGLTTMATTVGDTELELSPAAQLGVLKTALQTAASDPNDTILAQDLLSAARDMALSLNQASETVQGVRADADAAIADSVDQINKLLGQLEALNSVIVRGTQSGADVTDALDSRDQVLLSLSEEIGITTLSQGDGGVAVYTDSGVTLFETTARPVTFAATNTFTASTVGAAVYIDGVPVIGDNAVMPISSGRLSGLAMLRDEAAPTYQSQLDEIARGLIEAFAEADQTAVNPDQAGLFTWSGGPAVPATATLSVGLASDIRINANADPDQGGDLDLLRDGGISDPLDPNYDYNPADNAGFSARLQELLEKLEAPMVFDSTVELDPTDSLSGFSASSVSWMEARRQTVTDNLEVQSVIVARTAESLGNETGVNIDEEMTRLLELERAYAAAAKLISAVDNMLDDLLSAAR